MYDRLFSAGEAGDPTYVNLRDLKNEWTEPPKEFAESLWDRFRRFADTHFLIEIRRDFHSRFWEMYLTCALEEFANKQGSILSCPKPGPDILLEHAKSLMRRLCSATPTRYRRSIGNTNDI